MSLVEITCAVWHTTVTVSGCYYSQCLWESMQIMHHVHASCTALSSPTALPIPIFACTLTETDQSTKLFWFVVCPRMWDWYGVSLSRSSCRTCMHTGT